MSRVIILRKSNILLLGLWNTILRIVSFDYNVLSALRPDPSENNFEKAGGVCQAMACQMAVCECLQSLGYRGWGPGARPEVGGVRCRQYPGLAATLSSDTGPWLWRGGRCRTQYGSWHSQHRVTRHRSHGVSSWVRLLRLLTPVSVRWAAEVSELQWLVRVNTRGSWLTESTIWVWAEESSLVWAGPRSSWNSVQLQPPAQQLSVTSSPSSPPESRLLLELLPEENQFLSS